MRNKQFLADTFYLILLASTLGAILVLGIFVAPVIFGNSMLSHFENGVVMADIFNRFGYWLYFTLFGIILYEGYEFKSFKRDTPMMVATLTSIFSILMFNAVYTPKILEIQSFGEEATKSDEFANIRIASELDFKILATALLVMFIRRYYLITHPKR